MDRFSSQLLEDVLRRKLERGMRLDPALVDKVLGGLPLDLNDQLNVRDQLERTGLREGRDFEWK